MKAHSLFSTDFIFARNYRSAIYYTLLTFIVIIHCVITSTSSAMEPSMQTTPTDLFFEITIVSAGDTIILKGESELHTTPSSYSINMKEDKGSCAVHMLNFATEPEPGTYDVNDTKLVKTAMVCVLEGAEPKERLASQSGTFTITEMDYGYLAGKFDMILKGPLSGKEFHVVGQVRSGNTPSPMRFNQN